jgi:hypothetical protein
MDTKKSNKKSQFQGCLSKTGVLKRPLCEKRPARAFPDTRQAGEYRHFMPPALFRARISAKRGSRACIFRLSK